MIIKQKKGIVLGFKDFKGKDWKYVYGITIWNEYWAFQKWSSKKFDYFKKWESVIYYEKVIREKDLEKVEKK